MRSGHQIPLLHAPQRRVPPVATHTPGSINVLNHIAPLLKPEVCWLRVSQSYRDCFSRTKLAHGSAGLLRSRYRRLVRWNCDKPHATGHWCVCILEDGTADVLLAQNGFDTS